MVGSSFRSPFEWGCGIVHTTYFCVVLCCFFAAEIEDIAELNGCFEATRITAPGPLNLLTLSYHVKCY